MLKLSLITKITPTALHQVDPQFCKLSPLFKVGHSQELLDWYRE